MKMRALSALPLDDDIVDRIMTFCPTFSALQSTILVSKAFYNVFQTHPKSITRAVAYNIVGPALPQALRVVRYDIPDDDEDADLSDDIHLKKATELTPDEVAEKFPEDHAPSVITAAEKSLLQAHSRVVDELEDIYSSTQKDRTSRTSVLTAEESHRFRRAMYRIWLYTKIFTPERYDLEELEDGLSDGEIQRIQAQRAAVLSVFSTQEVREIWAVVRFLRGLFEASEDGDDLSSLYLDVLLATGPESALEVWRDRNHDAAQDRLGFNLFELDDFDERGLYAGYFDLAMKTVWVNRRVKAPEDEDAQSATAATAATTTTTTTAPAVAPVSTSTASAPAFMLPVAGTGFPAFVPTVVAGPGGSHMSDEERKKRERGDEVARKIVLVDGVVGASDTCSQCAAPGGLKLHCRGNWHRLTLHPSQLLKSNLRLNHSEVILFNPAAAHLPGTDGMGEWVEGLFAFREGVGSVVTTTTTTTVGGAGVASTSTTTAGTATAAGNPDPRLQIGTGTYAAWTADLSYCTDCLATFMVDHAWRWWLVERVKGGYSPPENCWYGYDCRTQTHKNYHAQTKNHLCVPTR